MNKQDLPNYDADMTEVGKHELELIESLAAFSNADFSLKEASLEEELSEKDKEALAQAQNTIKKVASLADFSLPEIVFNEHTFRGLQAGLAKNAEAIDEAVSHIFAASLGK